MSEKKLKLHISKAKKGEVEDIFFPSGVGMRVLLMRNQETDQLEDTHIVLDFKECDTNISKVPIESIKISIPLEALQNTICKIQCLMDHLKNNDEEFLNQSEASGVFIK